MSTAVVTGASAGLGMSFARQLRDYFPGVDRLWLIARRRDRLEKLAGELEKKMRQAAAELNFEEAARLRDRMIEVKKMLLDFE